MSRAPKKTQPETTRTAILAEREVLHHRLAALERAAALRIREGSDGDNTPSSDALDGVQAMLEKEEELAVRQSLLQRLEELTQAEERIRRGHYGICESCRQAIPPARLRSLPGASLCVHCAQEEERRAVAHPLRRPSRRPA